MTVMDDRHSTRQMIGTLLFLLTGPLIWAGHLTVLYGAQSSLCAFDAVDERTVTFLGLGLSALFVIIDLAAIVWSRPLMNLLSGDEAPHQLTSFLVKLMRGLAALSAVAMTYFALAVLVLPACQQLR